MGMWGRVSRFPSLAGAEGLSLGCCGPQSVRTAGFVVSSLSSLIIAGGAAWDGMELLPTPSRGAVHPQKWASPEVGTQAAVGTSPISPGRGRVPPTHPVPKLLDDTSPAPPPLRTTTLRRTHSTHHCKRPQTACGALWLWGPIAAWMELCPHATLHPRGPSAMGCPRQLSGPIGHPWAP